VSETPRFHREIDEDTTLDPATLFHPTLFTITSQPSFEMLCGAFDSAPYHTQQSPFLALYLEWQPLLECVQHFWPIIRWYRVLREHWSNKISREDAGRTPVSTLLEQADAPPGAADIFADFAQAWNAIIQLLMDGEPSSNELQAHDKKVEGRSFYERYREVSCEPVAPRLIPKMSGESMVSLCCLEEGQVAGNLLHIFVQLLGIVHNSFLDRIAQLTGRTRALRFKSLGSGVLDFNREVPLSQIQDAHMLFPKTDGSSLDGLNAKMASSYGICQPGYGCGKTLSFSFEAIEFQLAATLLTSASHIASDGGRAISCPPFEFAGELLQRSLNLLGDIDAVVPQEAFENMSTLRHAAADFLDGAHDVKNGRALLAVLEAVIFKCIKTRPSGDQLVAEFCEDFDVVGAGIGADAMKLRSFVQNVLRRVEVRLRHLCALHEEVEGSIATKVMKSSRPHERFNAQLDRKWRSPDPVLAGFDLVDHISASFGARMVGAPLSSVNYTMITAGRQRLQSALKLFVFRKLMNSLNTDEETADSQARWPLSSFMHDGGAIVKDFPWTKGSELTESEADQLDMMLPSDQVQVKHAYQLLEELQDRLAAQNVTKGTSAQEPRKPVGNSRKAPRLFGRA